MIKTLYPIFQKWSEKGSVYIISDTHFEDSDCKIMNPNWIAAEDQVSILKNLIHKNDTLIHLGDVGNPEFMSKIKGYKALILGNHDETTMKFIPYFNEIYTGPLFIAQKILLSHEPIYGLEKFCVNIHGHVHNGYSTETHVNLAADVCNYVPVSLGKMIENGLISKFDSIHRVTINNAVSNKCKKCGDII